jgi:threonylcarbamoyladenosine tRNA methylthiotransferase MtaB
MTNGLRDLVAAILAETSVPRLRLTSIAPWDLDESLLDLFTDSRLCRHLHLSLQAGSDTVLRWMRRPYTTAQFARAVDLARAKIPDVGITTDVIVGFPGESATEFEQSLEFVDRMQFSRVHVFPYSARAGTVAAKLPLPVDEPTKSMRMKQMQAIADFSQRAFANRFVGCTLNVLWESRQATEDQNSSVLRPPSSVWFGYTDNYIRVVAPSDDDLRNQITPARLISVVDDGAIGEVIRKYPK